VWFAVDGAVSRLAARARTPAAAATLLVGAIRVAGAPWRISELGEPLVEEVVLRPGRGSCVD